VVIRAIARIANHLWRFSVLSVAAIALAKRRERGECPSSLKSVHLSLTKDPFLFARADRRIKDVRVLRWTPAPIHETQIGEYRRIRAVGIMSSTSIRIDCDGRATLRLAIVEIPLLIVSRNFSSKYVVKCEIEITEFR